MSEALVSPLQLLRPGDWLVSLLGTLGVIASGVFLWQGGEAERVVIRSGGKIFAEVSINAQREIAVPGALGLTRVLIEGRRVRVASDPSPRQYCVLQGWMARPGEATICLPNQVSVELVGRTRAYDSLNY